MAQDSSTTATQAMSETPAYQQSKVMPQNTEHDNLSVSSPLPSEAATQDVTRGSSATATRVLSETPATHSGSTDTPLVDQKGGSAGTGTQDHKPSIGQARQQFFKVSFFSVLDYNRLPWHKIYVCCWITYTVKAPILQLPQCPTPLPLTRAASINRDTRFDA